MAKGGVRPGSGRPAGVPNKLTTTVKEAFEKAFHSMQADETVSLDVWGKANPTEFYKLASKMIPTDVGVTIGLQESAVDLLKRGT